MEKYTVSIEETFYRCIVVEAENIFDAENRAVKLYDEQTIVLTDDDYVCKNIVAIDVATEEDIAHYENYPACNETDNALDISNARGVRHLEALKVLHDAVDAGVLTSAGENSLLIYTPSGWQNISYDDAADNLIASDTMVMIKEATVEAIEDKKKSKQTGFTFADAVMDVVFFLSAQPEEFFTEQGQEKNDVLNDRNKLDKCASEHYRCVIRFGCDRAWSVKDACTCEPGIGD